MSFSADISSIIIWLAQAFTYSLIGLIVVGYLLIRYTLWGQQFWRIAHTFVLPMSAKKLIRPLTIGLIASLILFYSLAFFTYSGAKLAVEAFSLLIPEETSHWFLGLGYQLAFTVCFIVCAFALGLCLQVAGAYVLKLLGQAKYWRERALPVFPIFLFVVILFLSLFAVKLNVLFSDWYNAMYNSLQNHNEANFWFLMLVFAILAGIHIVRILLSYYLDQFFGIIWRTELNDRLVKKWMTHQNYYRIHYLKSSIDNPDQRIQQDVVTFASTSMDLILGVISSLVSTVAFTQILWKLSGPLTYAGVTIPHGMVFILFLYALIATVFAYKIGKPLIRLNFLNEKFNANYRYSLIRVREYAESIAFYHGEKVEQSKLTHHFSHVIKNAWDIVHRNLLFQGFNFAISQIAAVFPFIVQAGRFFTKQIQLGDMVQTANAFGTLHGNISFFRNAIDSFAAFKAVLDRLIQFLDCVEEAETLNRPQVSVGATQLKDLSVWSPNERLLIKDVNIQLHAGQALLLKGPSGSGKTTLLRTIAGLWPYTEGQVTRPDVVTLFLSQKPYLPEGTLLDALYYPQMAPENVNDEISQVLKAVNLGHLDNQLFKESNWMMSLSLGEQQRVAVARLLLIKPEIAFIDEATSAMDEGLEDAMYRLIRTSLPNLCLLSVGHRSTLIKHHDLVLELEGQDGKWQLQTPQEAIQKIEQMLNG
ncbi:ABC transporter ATP-binding protein/permease [Basilea psittacipulmonis]|uniref:ABC transporter ATP-binding protein/permease n=1 Tax=Basilea psittacipulmonis TaxID=1472345 RepID=UPI000AB58486|nr:ABC transporter ATP-binding protein/permease [Basilea psittacipulmonis]